MAAILPMNLETPNRVPWYVAALACAAVLAGPAYDSYLHYDFTHSTDSLSYMKMADGDFDVVVTHRYRVVVPALAKAASLPLSTIYGILWPHRDATAFHLRLGFFLVNLACMALVGWTLFRTCQAYGVSLAGSCIGVVGVLVSRWANCLASLPLVDAFHLLCVCLVLLALKNKNAWLLGVAIVLGPLSKESFVFIAPLTLLFGNMRVWLQVALYAIAGLLVVGIHLAIDAHVPASGVGSVQNGLQHLQNLPFSLKRLASPGGLGEVFTVLGLFNFVWLASLIKQDRMRLLTTIDLPLWLLLASCIVQSLISTSLARMLFVAAPLWAVLLGKSSQLLLEFAAQPESTTVQVRHAA